eukprot:TRINITY_DN9884_c0_g1_i2.p1 TRINITY_DN9884_c0_g1~~TRINITY_DN9884_c0_g1_i2.p1  ORF type:complete len:323 (+),score=36.54 TRINITY_DN9884_c0_g1_i2:54-1022(+)
MKTAALQDFEIPTDLPDFNSSLSTVMKDAKDLKAFVAQVKSIPCPNNVSEESKKKWDEVKSTIIEMSEGLLVMADMLVKELNGLYAVLQTEMPNDSLGTSEKQKVLSCTLHNFHNTMTKFLSLPVSSWSFLAHNFSTFLERYKTEVALAGSVGIVAGAVGGCYAGTLAVAALKAHHVCRGAQCVSYCINHTVVEALSNLGGGLVGAAIVLLLAYGIYKVAKGNTKIPELQTAEEKLKELKRTNLNDIVSLRTLHLTICKVTSSLVPLEGAECWVCLQNLTECVQDCSHVDTCAILPFTCQHPICFDCSPKILRCGKCQALPR